ncbi:MAG: CarD family transcriptional regulator [Clostridia bacterium]|nr:CarD family transcriptional regulator [Clostridia bacterium]
MFQKDEYVFYESGGICRISDIQVAPLEGMPADREYYVMQSVHDRNGVMYIPVDNDKVFMRRLLRREEAEGLIERIPSVEVIDEPNSKLLRTKYLEAMHTHSPEEWVRVIKTVYARTTRTTNRIQRLSETERSLSESAKRYLYTELALALGMQEKEMEGYITSRIEKMA